MKYYYDLHMHSTISACGDVLMSPNNIMNMASLIELDIISVTDHNCCIIYDYLDKLTSSYNLLVVPGCELSVENGHVLVYFKSFAEIKEFQSELEKYLSNEEYDVNFYGRQTIMNEYDMEVDDIKQFLQVNLSLTFDELINVVEKYDCLVVLAHIDKQSFSAINLVNENNYMNVDAIEVVDDNNLNSIYNQKPYLKSKTVLHNSDAHQIVDLSERENFLELSELTIDELFKVIKNE